LADKLAKEATEEPIFNEFLCSKFDVKSRVNCLINNEWNHIWEMTPPSNKLRFITHLVGPNIHANFLSRNEARILT
jgi:hypothetical protein